MKKFNVITQSIFLTITINSLPIYADTVVPTGFTSGSVLSDYVHYSIGGGAAVSPPPTGKIPNVYSLGVGWKSDLMCGNFDIKLTIKNQLNGITEGFKDLYSNVIESATGAVASLPAMIIQRANPQLYDILSNGLYQGKIDFSRLKTSCEEMSNQLADYAMDSQWAKMAGLENYKSITSEEPDAVKAKKKSEKEGGNKGVPWIGGTKKGGKNQEPIDVIKDVVSAGYNMALGRAVTNTNSAAQCDGMLCTEWKSPADAAKYAQEVLGSTTLKTCQECDDDMPSISQAGRGLAPQIEKSTIDKATKLEEALNSKSITVNMLNELSTSSISITRGLLETLRQDPDAPILAARLAQELAISKEMEKALMLRRVILMGMKEPNVAKNDPAQANLETILKRLDLEIEQVRLEMDLQRNISSNTALMILNNRINLQARAQYSNAPDDDKGLSKLNDKKGDDGLDNRNGGVRGFPSSIQRGYLVVPKLRGTGINNIYGSFNGSNNNSTGEISTVGNYTPIAPLNGSALDQATGLLRNFEGFSSTAYWDVNAYRTGYGSDTITKADGTVVRVTKDTVVTREDAERDLARRTQIFANTARKQLSDQTWNALPPNAQAALTSFAYNYGSLKDDIIRAAQTSAKTGDMSTLANAVRARQTNNDGINAKRRNQEADYILNKTQ